MRQHEHGLSYARACTRLCQSNVLHAITSHNASGTASRSRGPFGAAAEASCKTAFVLSLLAELIASGHRTLIFSQSRVMLNILQAAIAQRGWAFLRIDGTVVSSAQRAVSKRQPAFCT